jgi:hypothetical protein
MIWIVDGQPFASQFEVSEYPLPHPKSTLLEDVVFSSSTFSYPNRYIRDMIPYRSRIPYFYRMSEEKKEKVFDEDLTRRLRMNERRNDPGFVEELDVELHLMHSAKTIEKEIMADYRDHHLFRWERPRQVWMEASAPVFFDFGTHELFRLMRYPPISWCVQRISKQALVEKNGGTYSFIVER